MADNGTLGRVYTMTCPRPAVEVPLGTPELKPWDPVADKARELQRQKEANSLAIALLGPVFGGPAAAAQSAGAPAEVVGKFAELGLDLASMVVLGRGAARIQEPISTKSNSEISRAPSPLPRSGIVVKKKYTYEARQIEKKSKHSKDFGVDTTRKNSTTLSQYKTALEDHMSAPNTRMIGTYIHSPGFEVFYNPITNNVVIFDSGGNFLSGWRLTPGTTQYGDLVGKGKLF